VTGGIAAGPSTSPATADPDSITPRRGDLDSDRGEAGGLGLGVLAAVPSWRGAS
jgi:hypothetical protein